LDKETIDRLEKLAEATQRSKSFLVAEAVDRYLREQEWQVEAIKKGLEQAEKGHFTADNKVREFFKKRGIVVEG
jgi:predicted transcriptional regulator